MKNKLGRKILDETPFEVKESVMIAALKQYLAETPSEQIELDWKAVKDLNFNGPAVEDFVKNWAITFQESFSKIPESTTKKIRKYTDMIDEVEQIIDEAYKLYMPQVRSEITDLTKFVIANSGLKDGKPINILEIGTKFGGTFYIWNKINPNGMNISIDMTDGGIHGGISEEEMNKRDLWFQERFPNCHFIRGDSHEWRTFNKFSKILNPKEIFEHTQIFNQVDFLFIDGDHSYEGVKQDFLNFEPLCKPKSIIAFHDIIISEHHHSRNVFVGEFWNEVKNDSRFDSVEIIADINQTWAGIGILIKK